jgi:hypothetical protein
MCDGRADGKRSDNGPIPVWMRLVCRRIWYHQAVLVPVLTFTNGCIPVVVPGRILLAFVAVPVSAAAVRIW